MNLRDRNLRFALLKAIADAINDELNDERTDHTIDLVTRYKDEGTKSFDVRLPDGGPKVATISLSIPKPSTTVTEKDAFIDWCLVHMPSAVTTTVLPGEPERVIPATPDTTVYSVDQGMVTALLKGARPVDSTKGGLVVDDDGTVIEGVEHTPAGDPRSFSVRYETDGRTALADAYRSGELAGLVEGTALPQPVGAIGGWVDDVPVPLIPDDHVVVAEVVDYPLVGDHCD